ncbi:unnamed protein product, partial [Symbiodinium microadriaticum]
VPAAVPLMNGRLVEHEGGVVVSDTQGPNALVLLSHVPDQPLLRRYLQELVDLRRLPMVSETFRLQKVKIGLKKSIAAALQFQQHLTSAVEEKAPWSRDKRGKFLEAERFSYCSSGRATFAPTTVPIVVADAVHVGDDDCLNVFVCDPACTGAPAKSRWPDALGR